MDLENEIADLESSNAENNTIRISNLTEMKTKYEKSLQYLNYEIMSPKQLETIRFLKELEDE
jgi:hypothetical protein